MTELASGLQSRIIGNPGGLSELFQQIEIVSRSELPVLLQGETGSGKEVIAREIHQRSLRKGRPFVRVNCAAIPGSLIDAELFGHERGSFTGAHETRLGWFEQAHLGTLLLDEIGEMSLDVQSRLLRVLQEGEMFRVGGRRLIQVDVRIVAATNRDLRFLVKEGRFREDLYYRISTFPLRIPALRERRSDIVELAHHFIRRSAHRLGCPPPPLLPEHVDLLCQYAWPGNVRELISVIERAVILGARTSSLDLSTSLGSEVRSSPQFSQRSLEKSQGDELFDYHQVVRNHIERALIKCSGRVSGRLGAARLLGLNENTLRSKMRKYKISCSTFRHLDSQGDSRLD